ncbi:MAG TPA: TolC family protein [Opitutales bacterium]|nr:TolC family protein [Opitutales bacterium]
MPTFRQPHRPFARILARAIPGIIMLAAPLFAQSPESTDPLLQPLPEYVRPAPGQPLPATEQQFDEMLAFAATDSPVMREQADSVAQSDASRFRSWMRHMPLISASYSAGLYYQTSVSGSSSSTFTPGGSVTLQASEPLFHWGAFDAQTDLGILKEQIAQNDAILAYAQLCVDLRRRYLGLVVQKAQAGLLEARVASAKNRLDKQHLLLAQGRATPAQVNQSELDWNAAQIRRDEAQARFKSQLAEFRRLSGSRSFEARDVPDYIFVPVLDQSDLAAQYAEYQKNGFNQSLTARKADLDEKALDRQITISNANHLPMFDLTASISQAPYINDSNKGLKFATIFFIGVTGSWNLFDRGETLAATQALYAQKRLAETKLADSRDETFNDAQDSLNRIDLGLRALGVLKSEYQQQQQDYGRVQILQRTGQMEQTGLDDARDALLDTREQILSRQADIAAAYYSFLADIFRDPALANAPPFTKPR